MDAQLIEIKNDKAIIEVGGFKLSVGHDGIIDILSKPDLSFTDLFQDKTSLELGIKITNQTIMVSKSRSFANEFDDLREAIRSYEDILLTDELAIDFKIERPVYDSKRFNIPNWLKIV